MTMFRCAFPKYLLYKKELKKLKYILYKRGNANNMLIKSLLSICKTKKIGLKMRFKTSNTCD